MKHSIGDSLFQENKGAIPRQKDSNNAIVNRFWKPNPKKIYHKQKRTISRSMGITTSQILQLLQNFKTWHQPAYGSHNGLIRFHILTWQYKNQLRKDYDNCTLSKRELGNKNDTRNIRVKHSCWIGAQIRQCGLWKIKNFSKCHRILIV